jgi:hypothetical protein
MEFVFNIVKINIRFKFEFCITLYVPCEVSVSFSLLWNEHGRSGIPKLDRWNEVWDQPTALTRHNTITKSQVMKWLIKLVAKDIYVDFGS